MKFYFSLNDSEDRVQAAVNGYDAKPITLYPETEEIKNDYINNDNSDWWPVWKHHDFSWEAGEFRDIDEAMEEYMENEADEIYCFIHDC